ncbi:MAG: flagellar hook-length control protein FliK [Lachnospiraceae bacterium]|nr:flagellar hook-length control protein FliK [Lachnospiraceae bacterium]
MADLMIKGLTPNTAGTVNPVGGTEGERSEDAMQVFASMMCRTDGTAASDGSALTIAKANIRTADAQITPDTFRDKVVKEQPQTTGSGVSPEVADKLQEYNDKIKEAVMEEYDITEEELEEVMQTLGLEYIQLLLPENLVKLSVEITGAADSLELLSNTGFNNLFGMMQDLTTEITTELGVSVTPETTMEFAEMIGSTELPDTPVMETAAPLEENTASDDAMESAGNLNEEDIRADISVAPEETDEVKADAALADKVEELVETGIEKGTVEVVTTEPKKTETAEPKEEVRAEEADVTDRSAASGLTAEVEETAESSAGSGEEKNSFTGSRDNKTAARETRTETGTNTNTVAAFDNFRNLEPAVPVEMTQTLSQADTVDIIRQISDYMRINFNGSETSLEMQLNPENLGKVGINLSVRDGAVTAQIAVQNEAVKTALESQMVILRENMSNQGLKVEAVEVTVASHEFEQNLENGAPTGQQDGQQQGQQGRSTRNITASDLASIEDMPEDEQLAAKMMRDAGNSMDVTA